MDEMFTICKPFLGYKNPQTGETLIMILVKTAPIQHSLRKLCNINKVAFNYLLGATFDMEKNWVMTPKDRPRVDLNCQDAKGSTALHYAIQPSEAFAGKGFR